MDEYISREATVKAFCEKCKGYYDGHCVHRGECDIDVIQTAPAADVQPVKHGYWIKQPEKFQIYEDVINSNYLYSCSCCNASDLHSERANNDGEVKFCWRCGAKMDAEPDEPWQSE